MRKTEEDRQISVHFDDADFQQDLRVDPLTARDEIKAELSRLEYNEKVRKQEAEAKKQAEAKAEAEKKAVLVNEENEDEEV